MTGAPGDGRLDDLPDEELLLRCREASDDVVRRSVEVLARRHHRRLVNFTFRFVGNRESAEDLAQEAFVRVYRKAREYRNIAKFTTWLYRIATNLALNEIRNRGHRPSLTLSRPLNEEGGRGDLASTVPAVGEDPLAAAARNDMARAVHQAIGTLPEKYRAVLVLCDLQELSYADAAEALEINIGTVRSRLFRARAQFQQKMAKVVGATSADRGESGEHDTTASPEGRERVNSPSAESVEKKPAAARERGTSG